MEGETETEAEGERGRERGGGREEEKEWKWNRAKMGAHECDVAETGERTAGVFEENTNETPNRIVFKLPRT